MELSHCSEHPEFMTRFVCMEKRCTDPLMNCVFCIKERHEVCRQEFILDYDLVKERVKISNIKNDINL